MSLRPAGLRALLTCALAAAALVLVSPPGVTVDDPGDPTSCPWTNDATHALYTWVGGSNDSIWGFAANWTPPAGNPALVPNDDRQGGATPGADENEPGEAADTHNTYVCVPPGSTVNIDANTTRFPFVQGIWVGTGSTVTVRQGAGLFVQSESASVTSFFASGTTLNVVSGWLGGRGTLKSQGQVSITASNTAGASALSTKVANNETAAHIGELIVGQGGTMTLPERGVVLRYGYDLTVAGSLKLAKDPAKPAGSDGFLAAAWGTRTEIKPTGTLELAGDGGYYQGNRPTGVNVLSDLVNDGLLLKSAGSGTSVIDADYQGAGTVQVNSGTLALPDGTVTGSPALPDDARRGARRASGVITGDVGAGASLATGYCGGDFSPMESLPCTPTVSSADPVSVAYRASAAGPADNVVLEENDPGNVVFDGVSHNVIRVGAASATATNDQPTRLTFVYTSAKVDGRQLNELEMAKAPVATDVWHGVPDCLVTGKVQAEVDTCLDRPASSRDPATGAVTMVVNTVDSLESRYINRIAGTPVTATGSIMGQRVVGATLTASYTFVVAGPDNTMPAVVTYQWFADGAPLGPPSTVNTLTLTDAAYQKTVALSVVVTDPRWGSGQFSAKAGTVSAGTLDGTGATASPAPQVGVPLAVAGPPTGWPSGTSFDYQWQTGTTVLGTGPTFTPPAGIAELPLTLVTTGTRVGYNPAVRTTALGLVQKGVLHSSVPALTGSNRAKGTLTALAGSWSDGTTLTYQWYRNGARILGRTSNMLKLKKKWVGDKVHVVVTGTLAGYTGVSQPSATRKVKRA